MILLAIMSVPYCHFTINHNPVLSSCLVRLGLAHNVLGDAGAAALAAGLLVRQQGGGTGPSSGLLHLDLSANQIGPRGAEVCTVYKYT